MSHHLAFSVVGRPIPQGSKRHVGRGILVESSNVKPWRDSIVATAIEAAGMDWCGYAGPVRMEVTFAFRRPKSHYRTGANADLLRNGAPTFPSNQANGDLDKLLRAVFDALTTAAVIRDDSQVVEVSAGKIYLSPDQREGAEITVMRWS